MVFLGLPAALGVSIFAIVKGFGRGLAITALALASIELLILVGWIVWSVLAATMTA